MSASCQLFCEILLISYPQIERSIPIYERLTLGFVIILECGRQHRWIVAKRPAPVFVIDRRVRR
jgi:hypothetical protein